MNPNVSVIIPTRNRASLLPRAIDSILAQTYKDFEIVIIDGHSTDNTKEVVEGYNNCHIRYYLQQVPKNGAQATNEGIEKATGNYIAFLDDDDEWLPEKLAKQVTLLESLSEDYGMVYCWMDYYDVNGKMLHQTHPVLRGNIFEQVLLKESIGGTPTYLVRKSVIDKLGGFDTNLVFGDDGEFVRRIAKHFKIDFVPEVLTKVHINHGYVRQTDINDSTRQEAIYALMYILEKYKDDFNVRPKTKSVALATMACHFARAKNISEFLKYAKLSAQISLTPIGKYKMMAKSLINFIS
jgi:glycosyltransferase involved in cell wall biosynthesis